MYIHHHRGIIPPPHPMGGGVGTRDTGAYIDIILYYRLYNIYIYILYNIYILYIYYVYNVCI